MAKIFEWDARKGSFVEGVSKTVMTPTAMTFNRTDKGLAGFFNGTSGYISATNVINSKSIKTVCVWASSRTIQSNKNFFSMGDATAKNRFQFGYISSGFVCLYNGTSIIRLIESPEINKMYCFILLISDTQVKIIIDNVDYGWTNFTFNDFDSSFINIGANSLPSLFYNGDILKISLHSNTFGTEELNREYKEFLQSQITEKPVRGFELVKPTDLSYLKDTGLVAAYNMKPNGNTLVDISGNGRNGTLNGGLINTKDGLGFNGVNSYVNCGKTIGYGTEMTILGVINPDYTVRINIVGKDGGVSPKRGFYAEILNTGLIRFLFSQTGTTVQYYDSVTALGSKLKNTFAITFKGGVDSKIYINGVLDKTEPTALTSIFNNSLDFNIGFNAILNNYYNGEIQDIRVYNRELTKQEIKDYHNSFIKPEILEDWSNYAVGNTMPNEWIINSGAFVIAETTTRKYLACTSNGTIRINYPTTNTSVYASIEYYDGTSWITYTGLLSDLISTHAWLNLTGGYLEFTLTTSTRLGNIKIFDGVRQ